MWKGTNLSGLVGLLATAVLAVSGVSTAGGIWLGRSGFARPDALAMGTPPSTAPVTSRPYQDPQHVTVEFDRATPTPLSSPTAGRVTATWCQAGQTLTTGSAVLEVDGQAVLAIHTAVPLWRPLDYGTSGKDVTALQQALADHGADLAVSGTYGAATDRALRALFERAGAPIATRAAVPFDHLVWISAETVTADTCAFSLGDTVTVGQDLVTFPKVLMRISVTNPPASKVAGARQLDFGGSPIPTSDDGLVTDPSQLAAVMAMPQYQYGVASSQATPATMDLDWVLQDPPIVSTVPPRSVFGIADGRGCVASGGTVYPVTLVGSSLGSSLVRFDGTEAPPSDVDLNPEQLPCALS